LVLSNLYHTRIPYQKRPFVERLAKPSIDARAAKGRIVRVAVIDTAEMLRDLSMSASGKLHRSVGGDGEWQQWAVPAGGDEPGR
jgi:hypothetical protein